MKKYIFVLLFFLGLLPQSAKCQATLMYGQRVLPAGTMVLLETKQTIKSSEAFGKTLTFNVRNTIKSSDGYDLVKAGAMAIGKVKAIEASTANYPETIYIVAMSVQTIDGQFIDLSRDELTISARQTNEEAMINPLEIFTASIANNTIIKAF
jgi:hypothetical protein